MTIFDYFDYHKYLRDYYDEAKARDRDFSYRFIGSKTGIDPGYLLKVFQATKDLSMKYIPAFTKLLHLGRRESEYFELMVLFGRAKKDADIKVRFEKMLQYVELSTHRLEADKYEFYQKWYYTAVREVIGYSDFAEDYALLGKMVVPEISPAEAKKALELLLRLEMVRKNDQGRYEVASRFITTGDLWHSIAVRSFQADTIDLAKRAITEVPREERDISTVTVSLSAQGFDKLRECLKRTRQEMLKIAHEDLDVQRTYQVNLQLFPITRIPEGGPRP